MMNKPRLLREDEIECKVKRCTDKQVVLLLYKTARTDMDILDETYGPVNWQDDYKEIKDNLYCGIAVNTDAGLIWKWDCGIESREDEEGNQKKGEASDAFKRAGTRWGIGRELYTSPAIKIPAAAAGVVEWKGKPKTFATFRVEKIAYSDDRKIIGLSIINDDTGKRCFVWQKK